MNARNSDKSDELRLCRCHPGALVVEGGTANALEQVTKGRARQSLETELPEKETGILKTPGFGWSRLLKVRLNQMLAYRGVASDNSPQSCCLLRKPLPIAEISFPHDFRILVRGAPSCTD
jgi:hypothetical protein